VTYFIDMILEAPDLPGISVVATQSAFDAMLGASMLSLTPNQRNMQRLAHSVGLLAARQPLPRMILAIRSTGTDGSSRHRWINGSLEEPMDPNTSLYRIVSGGGTNRLEGRENVNRLGLNAIAKLYGITAITEVAIGSWSHDARCGHAAAFIMGILCGRRKVDELDAFITDDEYIRLLRKDVGGSFGDETLLTSNVRAARNLGDIPELDSSVLPFTLEYPESLAAD
jgi:hypothetical protein